MKEKHDEPEDDLSVLDEASQALFRFGRAFGRLPVREALNAGAEHGTELSAILVVQAVDRAEQTGCEVTVGVVARELGVDPSTASRLVAQAEKAGLVERRASLVDRRASALTLTGAGYALGEAASRFQREVFDAATSRWSEEERREFARLFVNFAEAIVAALISER